MRPCLPALLIFWLPLAASGADTKAPSTPPNFQVTGKTSTTVSLAWSASTDNVGVTGYEVLGSTPVGATAALTFTATGLQPGTTYRFFARARDRQEDRGLLPVLGHLSKGVLCQERGRQRLGREAHAPQLRLRQRGQRRRHDLRHVGRVRQAL